MSRAACIRTAVAFWEARRGPVYQFRFKPTDDSQNVLAHVAALEVPMSLVNPNVYRGEVLLQELISP